ADRLLRRARRRSALVARPGRSARRYATVARRGPRAGRAGGSLGCAGCRRAAGAGRRAASQGGVRRGPARVTGWGLLLSRPAEECAALAATLAEEGVHSASLPLLSIEPLPETPEQSALMRELDRYCAVVVVSKPAARLGVEWLDRYWPQPPSAQPWFSVG